VSYGIREIGDKEKVSGSDHTSGIYERAGFKAYAQRIEYWVNE